MRVRSIENSGMFEIAMTRPKSPPNVARPRKTPPTG
jgi:hypothetical protein